MDSQLHFPSVHAMEINCPALELMLLEHCPQAPHAFPDDMLTDREPAFIASETIRAHVFKNTHQEVPYATHVTIDTFTKQSHRTDIHATLWVERPCSQNDPRRSQRAHHQTNQHGRTSNIGAFIRCHCPFKSMGQSSA